MPKSTWPVASPPLVVDSWIAEPMSPIAPASLQQNFISDDDWIQLVFFMNNDPTTLIAGTSDHYVGYAGVKWPVSTDYTPVAPLFPSTKSTTLTTYVPVGYSTSQDSPISDYSGNLLRTSDFMSGRYKAESFLSQTNRQLSIRLLDLHNINPMTQQPTQVWAHQPYTIDTLPKAAVSKLVGWGGGWKIDFMAGKFSSLFTSVQSTVQSGPNQGQQLPALPITTLGGNPSYTDPLTGNTYAYGIMTGEVANLTETVTDVSVPSFPNSSLQVDGVPVIS